MSFRDKRYWIVGASAGLGRALAHELAKAGAQLILSARDRDALCKLADALPERRQHLVLPLDVTDAKALARAHARAGDYDGVIYAAGVYWPLSTQDWDIERIGTMVDINFTGALRVLGYATRDFIRRDAGHIVMIGSLAGFRGLRGAIGYGASKAALMHLGENIRADLQHSQIKVQVINPGFIKTRLTDKNDFNMPFIMSPEVAAQKVVAAMRGNRFETSFPRPFSWVFKIARFLPARLYFRWFGAKG